MIFIRTNDGWFRTEIDDIEDAKIIWHHNAQRYYDSIKQDYVDPLSPYRAKGFSPLPDDIKFRIWGFPESFRLFTDYY